MTEERELIRLLGSSAWEGHSPFSACSSLASLVFVACGGHTSTGASPDASADVQSPLVGKLQEAGQYDPGGDAGAFSASQVQAALALTANDAHGSPVNVSDGNDEAALLVGAWVLCPTEADGGDDGGDGGANVQTVFSPGMILAPGGAWTRLASDGHGGLVAARGVQNQGQWQAGCEASSDITNSCALQSRRHVGRHRRHSGAASRDMSTLGCYGGAMSFESSPRRMYVVDSPADTCDVNSDAGTFDLWLVPL